MSTLFLRHFDNAEWWATPIRWTAYHVKRRTPCHECLARLHASGGSGTRPGQARQRRTAGTTELLLCAQCSIPWRDEQERRKKAS